MTAPDPRLEEIESRLSKATPGPWEHDPDGFMGCGQVYTADPDLFGGNIAAPSGDLYPRSGYSPKEDMEFIASAPADVAYLLAELRKAQDALGRVEDVLDNWQAVVPFQDAEESQRWYSLGKRHAAERIRFELAGSRAAVAAATGGERG